MTSVGRGAKRRRVAAALALALVAGALPAGGPGPAQAAPGEGEWSSAGSLLIPRSGHTATRLDDGSVLVVGGDTGGGLSAVELSAVTAVHFGGEAATDVRVDPATPDTKLTAVVPAHRLGAVDVVVTTRPDPDGDPLRSLPRRLFSYTDPYTDTFSDTCADVVAGPGQVAYPPGWSMIGLPEGTVVDVQWPLYSWFDRGEGEYTVHGGSEPVVAGRGYWADFSCSRLVSASGPGVSTASFGLGGYHASMVGNPSGTEAVTVSGFDFAARWDPTLNDGEGDYILSGFQEPIRLAVGEAVWAFSYTDTTIKITP